MVSRLVIEYDGSAFKGWAKQPGQRTLEGELDRVLAIVRREPAKLTVAGRTDAGVHAWGQVASHPGAPAGADSLNALLPDDVSVLHSEEAPESFDARADALSRTYCYRVWTQPSRPALLRGRVWHWGWPLDTALLRRCGERIVGEHDFEAFTLSHEPYKSYRRVMLRAEWIERDGGLLEFWLEGETFTRRVVRALVAYQLDVAAGRRSFADFERLLGGGTRTDGGGTAPADGLYLAAVGYDPPLAGAIQFGVAPV